jgi:hypothetical protein
MVQASFDWLFGAGADAMRRYVLYREIAVVILLVALTMLLVRLFQRRPF